MKIITNQNGFTYILALTIVMIMGVMLGMVGQSWKTIRQRDQEKELLFRGSQIKRAIENWHKKNPNNPLMNLEDLLKDPNSLTLIKFLPQNYAMQLSGTNSKCSPDCAKLKINEDPITGRNWEIIKGRYVNNIAVPSPPGTVNGEIIGVSSQSSESHFRNYFKDTELEIFQNSTSATLPVFPNVTSARSGYSDWKFISDTQNDQKQIYKAYHEGR